MKPILIQHGEKIALLLVLIICAIWINGVLGDAKTQPNKTSTPAAVDALLKGIAGRQGKSAPQPKQPFDYTGVIKKRMGVTVHAGQAMQWAWAHPDIIIGEVEDSQVYTAYEVHAPSAEVTDEGGSIVVKIQAPSAQSRSNKKGVAGGSQWVENERETAQNTASWLGVKVEYKIGKGGWMPMLTSGLTKEGYYFFTATEDGDGLDTTIPEFILSGIQGEQRYEFRAQLLVKATGIVEKGMSLTGNEVIVYSGKVAEVNRPKWAQIGGRINGRLMPLAVDAIPAGIVLGERESAYLSVVGELVIIEKADTDVIFALRSVSAQPDQPMKARILMRKKVRNSLGTILGWTNQYEFKDVGIGDRVGVPKKQDSDLKKDEVKVLVGDRERAVLFKTDWTIKDIKMDAVRTIYYVVKKQVNPANNKIQLVLKPKLSPSYQVVTVVNSSGDELVLPKLKSLTIPERLLPYVYPHLPNGDVKFDVVDVFKNGDPKDFVNPIMVPEEPVVHPPEDLVNYNGDAETNIPFYVFADDRYVYWDHLARKLKAAEVIRPEVEEPEVGEELDGEEVDPEAEALEEAGGK